MIILDTHVWIWWVSNPENLSLRARKLLDSALENDTILISSISTWEVALLVAKDRLKLTMEVADWINKSERLPCITFIPVDNAIAIKSASLPEPFHVDPADRIIVATSLIIGAPLVTKDKRIRNYPYVETVW